MPFTKEEFIHQAKANLAKDPDVIEAVLKELPTEKRLEGVSMDELLRKLSPEMLAELRRRLQEGK